MTLKLNCLLFFIAIVTLSCNNDRIIPIPATALRPDRIIIHKVSVLPQIEGTDLNNRAWDEGSPPDIFIEYAGESGTIEYSDTLNDFTGSQESVIIEDANLVINDPDFNLSYLVFDYDESPIPGLADDFVEQKNKRFYRPTFEEGVSSVVSGTLVKVKWEFEYVYE